MIKVFCFVLFVCGSGSIYISNSDIVRLSLWASTCGTWDVLKTVPVPYSVHLPFCPSIRLCLLLLLLFCLSFINIEAWNWTDAFPFDKDLVLASHLLKSLKWDKGVPQWTLFVVVLLLLCNLFSVEFVCLGPLSHQSDTHMSFFKTCIYAVYNLHSLCFTSSH